MVTPMPDTNAITLTTPDQSHARPNWPALPDLSKRGFHILAHNTKAIDNLRRMLEAALTFGNGPSLTDRGLGVIQRDFATEIGMPVRRRAPIRRYRKPVDYQAEAVRALLRRMENAGKDKAAADAVSAHIIAMRELCANIADTPFKDAVPRPELGPHIFSAVLGQDVVFCRVWPKAAAVLAIIPQEEDYQTKLSDDDVAACRHAATWLTDGVR